MLLVLTDGKVALQLLVTDERQLQGVLAVGQVHDVKQAFFIRYGTAKRFRVTLFENHYIDEGHRLVHALVQHFTSYAALGKSCQGAYRQQAKQYCSFHDIYDVFL